MLLFEGIEKKRSPLLGFCKFQRHLRNTLCCPSDMMSFLPCTHASTSGHASDQAPFGQLQVRPPGNLIENVANMEYC